MSYYISVKEAAEYLEVDMTLVRQLLAKGWLVGEKVERVWRIPADAVESFYAVVVPGAAAFQSDSRGEMVLAHNQRCPVCAGSFQSTPRGPSSFSNEFLECYDCSLSLHESLLNNETNLSRHVAQHGQGLEKKDQDGLRARSLLLRRKTALRKVEAHLE